MDIRSVKSHHNSEKRYHCHSPIHRWKNWDSEKLSNFFKVIQAVSWAGMWSRLFWHADGDLNLCALSPTLCGKQIININYLYAFWSTLLRKGFSQKTAEERFGALTSVSKIGFDSCRLSLIRAWNSRPGFVFLGLLCFAIFGVDVKAESRAEDYIWLEEGERGEEMGEKKKQLIARTLSGVLLIISLSFYNFWNNLNPNIYMAKPPLLSTSFRSLVKCLISSLLFPSLIIQPLLPILLAHLIYFQSTSYHLTDDKYFQSPYHWNGSLMRAGTLLLFLLFTTESWAFRRYLIHSRCSIHHFE